MSMTTFSDNLRSIAVKRGLSLLDLARSTNKSYSALKKYVAGDREPSISTAKELAEALGVTLDELASGHVNENEPSKKLDGLVSVLTEDEIAELVRYADYIVSKRAEKGTNGS